MQGVEPGKAVDDKFAGGRRTPQIDCSKDKARDDPEHLHRIETVFVE